MTGTTVIECGLCVSQGNPWLACSPDGLVFENDQKKLIEIKCPIIGTHLFSNNDDNKRSICLGKEKPVEECLDSLKFLTWTGNGYVLKKKHHYYAQVQLCMCILNITRCDFVIYSSFSKSVKTIDVEIDTTFCMALMCKLKDIFFHNMLHFLCDKVPN